MMTDAFRDAFDVALLVTADSDLRPAIDAICAIYPNETDRCLLSSREGIKRTCRCGDGLLFHWTRKVEGCPVPDCASRRCGTNGNTNNRTEAYAGLVDTLKVPKAEFDAVLAALLKAPPMPMSGISPKRPKPKPTKKR